MGINPLNLQLSVPRTPEISTLQQQAMQRPVTEQTILASNALKHTDELRSVANSVDEIDKALIRDQEQANQQEQKSKKQKKNDTRLDQELSDDSKHPYKGHRFDIRL
ncbi:MAG: hypothetical protein NAG76_16575 [Candidatus Pristimantibacillus lignocellulolyticus]|uniref:Uncharacterized protein n=1 Tax=Candidatus Pristimantibacillus lignocellulolyticus TaxID=2994561 RepID=A0A9J6ZBI8_9BACL|nr:MAG: hypothetical protein NAG76_16575 [Candidatus Pristimantibacillus lignocellulolyticus]